MKQKVTEVQEVDTLQSKCKIFNTVISVIDKLSRQKKWQWGCSGFEENKFDPISMHRTLYPTVIEYIFFLNVHKIFIKTDQIQRISEVFYYVYHFIWLQWNC